MLWDRRTELRAVQHKTPYSVGCVPCSLRLLPRCLTVALSMHVHLERLQLLPVCHIMLSHASQQLTERLACVVSSSSGRTAAARMSVSARLPAGMTRLWRHRERSCVAVCFARDPARYLLGWRVTVWCHHWPATPCVGQHARAQMETARECGARIAVPAVWATWTSTPRPVILRVVFEVVPDLHACCCSSRSCRGSADVVVQQEPSKGSSNGPAMHE